MKKIFVFFSFVAVVLLMPIYAFAENETIMIKDLGDYKIVGTDGYVVTPPHGAAFVLPKNIGVIDKDGNFVIEPVYDSIEEHIEGRSLFKKDGLYGYFDENWNIVIPAQFKKAKDFSLGLAAVANDDLKYGYIDYNGNVAIDFQYDGANSFYDGCALVEKTEVGYNYNTFTSYGIINHAGTLLRPFIYNYSGMPCVVQMSANKIQLNGYIYNNNELEYPFINHNGVTYLPLTFYNCMHVGFTTIWSEDGLIITPPNSVPSVGGDANGRFENVLGDNNMKKGEFFHAELYKGKLIIAGKTYIAQDVYYPLLVWNDVVYVPVLWRQGMEAMGLDYTYDLESYSVIINSR